MHNMQMYPYEQQDNKTRPVLSRKNQADICCVPDKSYPC